FYKELLNQKKVGISGLTKDYQAIRINATTKKLDNSEKYIDKMFINNPSMNEVYPGVSRSILEAFTLDNGEVEFFDLSQSPIHRETFSLNRGNISLKGFCISDECISCGTCYDICPQNAIKEEDHYNISQENCLHCGLCFENCPSSAIYKRSDFKC
ncbi:4Fe-4S binding protein, partial [Methanobrevibacter sp. OttesenSCG-928-I08]|nr:4Fe-4S binding protein [Methanobrevibacter sp. OttesenSCG-928-I08]